MLDIILVLVGIVMIICGIYGLRKGEESPGSMIWLIVIGVVIELAAAKSYIF